MSSGPVTDAHDRQDTKELTTIGAWNRAGYALAVWLPTRLQQAKRIRQTALRRLR